MSNRRNRVPLIPKGPTPVPAKPPAPAESEAEQKAKAALVLERTARGQRCMAELQAVLAKHKCVVVGRTIINYDGSHPVLEWDVAAQ